MKDTVRYALPPAALVAFAVMTMVGTSSLWVTITGPLAIGAIFYFFYSMLDRNPAAGNDERETDTVHRSL